MSDEQKPAPEPKAEKKAAKKKAAKSTPRGNIAVPIENPDFLIDEDAGTVATFVGAVGNPGRIEDDSDEDITERSVTTHVGDVGWPEGAENKEGTGPE